MTICEDIFDTILFDTNLVLTNKSFQPEDGLLGDAKESGDGGEDEDGEPGEDVDGEQSFSEVRRKPFKYYQNDICQISSKNNIDINSLLASNLGLILAQNLLVLP